MQMATKTRTTIRLSFPALGGPPPLRAQAQRGGVPPVLWEARRAVRVQVWTMSCLDSVVGEVAVVAVVGMRFLDLEGEGLCLALGVVRMARQCRRLRMAVVGSKVMIGLIGEAGEMVLVGGVWVVVDTKAVGGAREDLEVEGVAHGGMDQVDSVGADDTELSSFYNLLSFSRSFFPWCTLNKRETVYILQLLS